MQRKTVFGGAFLAEGVPEGDRPALELALATLKGLADRGVIEFRRNAGRTVGTGRRPENVLTPQARLVLAAGAGFEGRFNVGSLRAATGINRNSLTAVLHKLAAEGFLEKRSEPLPARAGYGHTHQWTYAMTERGLAVARHAAAREDQAREAEAPAPPGPR